jgi:hypothetical protein
LPVDVGWPQSCPHTIRSLSQMTGVLVMLHNATGKSSVTKWALRSVWYT